MSSPTADRADRFHPVPVAAEDIQRRRLLHEKWRRHSARIHTLRALLPVLVVLTLVALAGWTAMSTLAWRTGAANQGGDLTIRMLKPNFEGRNAPGRPYLLSADSAVRDGADSAKVTLEVPVFTLGSGLPGETRVRARHGLYREDTRILDLTGDVHLDDAAGYHFITDHAVIDTLKNDVDGERHIDGHGPLGRIAASSYAVRDGGAHVFFNGQVKTRIEHQGALAASAKH
jgi:lipopolysaccharide export system protein LptC